MRRIPRHVLARNRQNSYADEQALITKGHVTKTGGRCVRVMQNGQVCNQLEDDHFAGQCEDWGPYTPMEAAHA